jgi:hypothetical protein
MDTLRSKFEQHFNIIICNDYVDRDEQFLQGESKTLKNITVAFGGKANEVSQYWIWMFRGGKYERGAADVGQPRHRWERDGIQYYGVGGQQVKVEKTLLEPMTLTFPTALGHELSSEEVDEMAYEIGLSASVAPHEDAIEDADAAETEDQPGTYDAGTEPAAGDGDQEAAPQEDPPVEAAQEDTPQEAAP